MKPASPEAPLSAEVARLLKPIAASEPAGHDARDDESYSRLATEINKVVPDFRLCIDLATKVLEEQSKDLRIAAWLCYAWYREDKLPGLINGLTLVAELMKKFSAGLYPLASVQRGKALQFLGTDRVVRKLKTEDITRATMPLFLELSRAWELLEEAARAVLGDTAPEMMSLKEAIVEQAKSAKEMTETRPAPASANPAKPPEKAPPPPARREEPPSAAPKTEPAPAPPPASLREVSASSEKEAVVAVKRAIKYFFEQEADPAKQHESYVFAVSRSLVWARAVRPPSENDLTPLAAPDGAVQNKLKEWHGAKEWDRLIMAVELNFLDDDSGFKFWLTAQRYVCDALEQKGGSAVRAAEEIKSHLARLLQRLPDLSRLMFANRTPFVDEDTARWVDTSVRPLVGKGGAADAPLPPILGEDYEPINKEYRAACGELPANFEKNLKFLQEGMSGEIRRKGRFLRTLNLANFCLAAKQHGLARTYVSQLLDKIEAYQLAEWEPALCLATWECAFLVNKKLMEGEKNKDRLEVLDQQQRDLFTRIGTIDGVLALRLTRLK